MHTTSVAGGVSSVCWVRPRRTARNRLCIRVSHRDANILGDVDRRDLRDAVQSNWTILNILESTYTLLHTRRRCRFVIAYDVAFPAQRKTYCRTRHPVA
jgi:hypothetical protein